MSDRFSKMAWEWLGEGHNITSRTLAALLRKVHDEARRSEDRKIAAWLRTTPRARGVLLQITASNAIALLAEAIDHDEHETAGDHDDVLKFKAGGK